MVSPWHACFSACPGTLVVYAEQHLYCHNHPWPIHALITMDEHGLVCGVGQKRAYPGEILRLRCKEWLQRHAEALQTHPYRQFTLFMHAPHLL